MGNFKLINGDCTLAHEQIESNSVDLILTDLPYGVVKMKESSGNYKVLNTAETWDKAIEPKTIYDIANRILRKNGKMILFSQEPYTSRMITEAIPNIPFSYRAIWKKNDFANGLGVNKAMVSFYEDILIFSKNHQKHDFEGTHPLREYFKDVLDFIGLNLREINKTLGHRRAEHTFYVTPKQAIVSEIGQKADHCTRFGSTQFSLCTEKTYNEITQVFKLYEMPFYKSYSYLKQKDNEYRTELLRQMNEQYPSVFNLWEGKKYKSNILEYKKDYSGYHPTQKPILLLEDLIKTFSNENDLVVDLTMGSGSTGVACKSTKRNFIGIELSEKYFEIANKRINEPKLF